MPYTVSQDNIAVISAKTDCSNLYNRWILDTEQLDENKMSDNLSPFSEYHLLVALSKVEPTEKLTQKHIIKDCTYLRSL